MPITNNKISVRQLVVLYTISALSPAIRIVPQMSAKIAGQAAWLGPLFAFAILFAQVQMLTAIFKRNNYTNLSDIFDNSFGKPISKGLHVIYFAWVLLLFLLYIRYYGERLEITIFSNADVRFFIILMLIIVLFVIRKDIENLARFSEFTLVFFLVIFFFLYLFLIPSIKVENILPIAKSDVLPGMLAAKPVLVFTSYITLFFFLGDYVKEVGVSFKKPAINSILLHCISFSIMVICVVGSLGPTVSARMLLPFFNATKLIKILDSFNRIEAFLVSSWVVTDFMIISCFALILMNIGKRLFNTKSEKHFAGPFVLLGYIGSLVIAENRFELDAISGADFTFWINIALCIFVPLLALIIGRMRKKI